MVASVTNRILERFRRPVGAPAAAAPAFEQLESRLLLSMLGVGLEMELPNLYYDVTGTLSYTATTEEFDATAVPLYFIDVLAVGLINPPSDFQLHINVDNSGALTGEPAGDDLVVEGVIDLDWDGKPEFEGVLLTGEALAFGYLDSGVTDQYDFRFAPTGGELMSYFDGKDIGMVLNSPNSNFTGSFAEDFAGEAHGVVGPIEPLEQPADVPGSLAGRVFVDADDNGVYTAGEAGIEGVDVALSGTNADGPVALATLTGPDGSYLFENLLPGTYELTETQPAGYLDGTDSAGSLGGTAGNDVIGEIVVGSAQDGTGYDFGELLPLTAVDIQNYVRVEVISAGDTVMCREYDFGKPVTLTFAYTGGGEDATDTGQAEGKYAVSGDPNEAAAVHIVASSEKYLSDVLPANTLFSGTVGLGDKFVLDVANASGLDSFRSNTYIFLQDTGGEVLQTVQYHTSCSTPITLGDIVGGLTLTGFFGTNGIGASLADEPGDDIGEDADEPTGPEAAIGDMAIWTYIVTNPGDVQLGGVVVTDDNGTPGDAGDDFNPAPVEQDGFNVGDTDADGRLDPGEQWRYTATDIVEVEGQHANLATVTGTPLDDSGAPFGADNVTADDPAHHFAVLPAIPVCQSGEKPQVLTMRYTGDGADATSHSQDPDKVTVEGDPADAQVVRIVAASKSSLDDPKAEIFFDGSVALGETFAIDSADADMGKLKSETHLFIFDAVTGELLQTVRFHTSCSQPLILGDQFGAVQLRGFLGEGGTKLGIVPVELLTSLSGAVYEDFNGDGELNFGETAIQGVTVALAGVDDLGAAVSRTAVTDEDGVYFFDHLRPGTYAITETQPAGYEDGPEGLGSAGGTVANDAFTDIQLGAYVDGVNYNFGERPEVGAQVAAGQTATIAFWHSKEGKRLIEKLNGGRSSKQLGDWLAATFPNLYGKLAGKRNKDVRRFYDKLFKKIKRGKGKHGEDIHGGIRSLEAQVMSTALAAYVTSSSLAGTLAAGYGFYVTTYGVGIATWNVGSSGAAFGVADNIEMTIMDILRATNEQSYEGRAYYYDVDAVLRNLAVAAYEAVNESGQI